MKIVRALHNTSLLTCGCALILFSGCATAPKPAQKSASPAATTLSVPPAQAPATKPAPAPGAAPAAENPVSAPLAPPPSQSAAAPAPIPAPTAPVTAVAPTATVGRATITGSQEASILLDNFTAFVASIDGKKVPLGRKGWDFPLAIEAGHRVLGVEFNRGVFLSRATLEFDAAANARYELKYNTDAELFGHNSFCNFWIVDASTGKAVSTIMKASVEKASESASTVSAQP